MSRSHVAVQNSGNEEQLLWADVDKQGQSSSFPLLNYFQNEVDMVHKIILKSFREIL